MGKNKLMFLFFAHQSMDRFCHMTASRRSSRKYRKNIYIPISNIELVLTHIILELGMLGIARKFLVYSMTFLEKKFKKD